MLMKDVMQCIHQMTETLQSPELKIVDAMVIIQSTVQLLKKIRDDRDTVVQEINAGIITLLKNVGNDDAEEEFQWKQQVRKAPIRFYQNQDTAEKITLHHFY